MKRNRKRVVTGLVATGLVAGALAGGGVALASAGAAPAAATSTTSTPAGPSYGPGSGYLVPFCGMYGTYGMHGRWSGQQPVMTAAADYLGLSLAQLQAQLQPGTSLADIAKAHGKAVAGLKDALLAAVTSRINASTGLGAQQKAAVISEVKDHLDAVINTDMPHSPGTRMGWHMTGTSWPGGGMWR